MPIPAWSQDEVVTGPVLLDTTHTCIPEFTAEVHHGIGTVDAGDWDACNGSGHRLASHAYLRVLEESGVFEEAGGFEPRLVLLRDGSGRAVAAAPAYLKSHSVGELGADFGFPLSHARSCGAYYPKLQVEVPMTPIVGPRLLVAAGEDGQRLRHGLLDILKLIASAEGCSSLQVSFMSQADREAAVDASMLIGTDIQFVWQNRGYGTFSDFTTLMSKGRRAMVGRERREALGDDLSIEWLHGPAILALDAERLSEIFGNTFEKYGTKNWFTAAYFRKLFEYLSEHVSLVAVRRESGEVIAATLFLESGNDLFALQWGASEFKRFLMLETTIYQGIERAIGAGFSTFNLGSLGRHKSNRGALPTDVYHAYWFCNSAYDPIARATLLARQKTVLRERQLAMATFAIRPDIQVKNTTQ